MITLQTISACVQVLRSLPDQFSFAFIPVWKTGQFHCKKNGREDCIVDEAFILSMADENQRVSINKVSVVPLPYFTQLLNLVKLLAARAFNGMR